MNTLNNQNTMKDRVDLNESMTVAVESHSKVKKKVVQVVRKSN